MKEAGETDASLDRARTVLFGKARGLRVIVARFERAREHGIHIDRIFHDLSRCGGIAGMEKIPATYFLRCNANDRGDLVHVPLQREETLRCTESAESTMRWNVRRHCFCADTEMRPQVRSSRVNRAPRKNDGRERGVGATVDGKFDLSAQQLAVARNRRFMPRSRRMAFRCRGHIFATVVTDFYGASGLLRQKRRMRSNHGREIFLATEGSTGLGLDHAALIFGQIEGHHQSMVQVVRALQRAVYGHALFFAVLRNASVVFNVELLLRAGAVLAFNDEGGIVPNRIDVALLHHIALEGVVFSPHDGVHPLALFDCEDRGPWLVLNLDGGNSLRKPRAIRMGEQENRLFGMVDELIGEAGMVLDQMNNGVGARNIFRCNDDKLAPVDFFAELDRNNTTTRDFRPYCRPKPHTRERKVIDVLRFSQYLSRSLFTKRRGADDLFLCGIHGVPGHVQICPSIAKAAWMSFAALASGADQLLFDQRNAVCDILHPLQLRRLKLDDESLFHGHGQVDVVERIHSGPSAAAGSGAAPGASARSGATRVSSPRSCARPRCAPCFPGLGRRRCDPANAPRYRAIPGLQPAPS